MIAIVVAVVMLIGLVFIVLPFLPGLSLMWLAALAYGSLDHFGTGGVIAFSFITVLVVVGEVLGFVLPGRSAAKAGAPRSSIAIGTLAACVGFFVIPVFGFPIGAILGIYLAEFARTSNSQIAWDTTVSTLVGFGVTALVQLALGVVVIISWLAWVVLA